MSNTIVCIGGRCSTWGTSWKRHFYDGGETCLRCGMDRKEQFYEDKAEGLVTGAYVPNTARVRKPNTSKQVVYCVVGEYGIEFASPDKRKAQEFIDCEVAGTGHGDEPVDSDYYDIKTMTREELDALPEV